MADIKFSKSVITLPGNYLQDIWDRLVNKPNRSAEWTEADKDTAFAYLEHIIANAKQSGGKAPPPPTKSVDQIVAEALEATGMTLNGGTVVDPLDDEDDEEEPDETQAVG